MTEERAVLAGGCFWGMQDLFRHHDGVISTRVGYTGGDVPNATYRNHGTHAEAIEIIFDPPKLSYRVAFLMKDLVLLAVSFYLLKQDVRRVSLPAQRVAPDWLERVRHQRERGAARTGPEDRLREFKVLPLYCGRRRPTKDKVS
jgi:Peptide methionine sulfoxide reductase